MYTTATRLQEEEVVVEKEEGRIGLVYVVYEVVDEEEERIMWLNLKS